MSYTTIVYLLFSSWTVLILSIAVAYHYWARSRLLQLEITIWKTLVETEREEWVKLSKRMEDKWVTFVRERLDQQDES